MPAIDDANGANAVLIRGRAPRSSTKLPTSIESEFGDRHDLADKPLRFPVIREPVGPDEEALNSNSSDVCDSEPSVLVKKRKYGGGEGS